MGNSIFADNNSNIDKSVKVEIYSTEYCPYCTRARMLLDSKGIPYIELRVDRDINLRYEMERRSNRTSVPQIFIGNRHIGGFDDLAELEFGEELDGILGLN
ncbi:MAG: glutaredoxin 3 [Gammaproteobacteria bacterium]|nr:glutaredoxin 3 [Gammaproteobacteria bacterium]